MRILFAAVGTRGDLQPLVPPALEMMRRGHDVALGGPSNFRGWVEGIGIPFVSIMESVVDIKASQGILYAARDQGDAILDATAAAARGAALIVATGPHPAAFTAAEIVGARYVYVAPSPTYLRSSGHAPLGSASWPLATMNRIHWRVQETAFQVIFGRAANAARKKRGLRPISSLLHAQFSSGEVLFAFDTELEPLPADIAGKGTVVGPLIYAEPEELPAEVAAFLAAGEPPIYFGFGSMGDVPAARMIELAKAVASRCNTRVLLLPTTSLGAGNQVTFAQLTPEVAAVGRLDHAKLFPRTRGVVHHGGAGTTYSSALAGVPQAVVAHRGDQSWFGRRVHALGLGPPPLKVAKLDEESAVGLVRALLADLGFAERAKAYRSRVSAHGGAVAAADALEKLARKPS